MVSEIIELIAILIGGFVAFIVIGFIVLCIVAFIATSIEFYLKDKRGGV